MSFVIQCYLLHLLFLDFHRWDDQFVVATFDGPPTVDSESYNKMDKSVRDAHEAQVCCVYLMKIRA